MTSSKTVQNPEDLVDAGHQVGEQADPAARPVRRTFTAGYRAQLVAEYEAAPHGQKSAVLRREGLYHSTVREWMQARDAVAREASRPTRRHGSGRAGGTDDPGSLADAREFCAGFFHEYNFVHRHSGIARHTPASVHFGTSAAIDQARQNTLTAAYQANPQRFGRRPHPPIMPTQFWINEPVNQPQIN